MKIVLPNPPSYSKPITALLISCALLSACKPSPPSQPPAPPLPQPTPVAPKNPGNEGEETPNAQPQREAQGEPQGEPQGEAYQEDAYQDAYQEDATYEPLPLPDIVAQVNGKDIKKEEVEAAFQEVLLGQALKIESLPPQDQLEGYRQITKELIQKNLMLQASANETISKEEVMAEVDFLRSNFANDKEFKSYLKSSELTLKSLKKGIEEELKIKKWMTPKLNTTPISEKDALKFYEENKTDFEKPETVRASHIFFMADQGATEEISKTKKQEADKAYQRAKDGENFENLVAELSEDPNKTENQGDVGFFSKESIIPEFAAAVFNQNVGEVGEPIQSTFGWHVVKITEKQPAETITFSDAKKDIIEYLEYMSQVDAQNKAIQELEETAKIEINLPEKLKTEDPAKTNNQEIPETAPAPQTANEQSASPTPNLLPNPGTIVAAGEVPPEEIAQILKEPNETKKEMEELTAQPTKTEKKNPTKKTGPDNK